MSEDMKVMLVAMVLSYCKHHGLSQKEVLSMFSKSVVNGGYKILERRNEHIQASIQDR